MCNTTTSNSPVASNLVHTCVEPVIFCQECGCDLTPANYCSPDWLSVFEISNPECTECWNRIEPDDHEPGFDPQD